jgi:hypothetical protein
MFGVSAEMARYIGAGLIAVIWVLKLSAPYLKAAAKSAAKRVSALWPKVNQKTNVLSAWPLIGILLILCVPVPGSKCPVPEPVKPPDIVAKCSEANRVLIAEQIRKFSGEKYETVQAAEDAMNQKILEAYQASYEPLFQKINEARKADKLVEFAGQIEKGEIQ